MNYTYVECEENESQYEDYNLNEEHIVDAIYVKAKMEVDEGNPYIEALPYPRDNESVKLAYMKMLPAYRFDKVKSLSKLDKMLQVGMLREIRFPLPFHRDLEFHFYNSLLTSYRARNPIVSKTPNVVYTTSNQTQSTDRVLCGDSGAATNAGFSLIGFSGCGKSSAIKTLVSHYPQVIMHQDAQGGYFPQIVYLVVNCVSNSNFSALYEGIGDAIDKAFGNTEPVYAKEIARAGGLGKKAEKVRIYVEKFGIGMIIFDEIQLLDFEHTKENTFDSLLTLANRTKVAVAVVGTEDARDKMFKELRTARRIGTMINGNHYCENKKFFKLLVKQLFQYQWFDAQTEVSDEVVDALYDVTKGIVDQLIGVYSCMNYEYLDKKTKPEINAEYVYTVAKKYYPGIQAVLADLEITENERKFVEIRECAAMKVNKMIDAAQQDAVMESAIKDSKSDAMISVQLQNVVANITNIYDEYTTNQIEEAFYKVIKKKSSSDMTEKEITRAVIDKLQSAKSKKSTMQNKPDIEHMQDFINKKG